MPRATITSYTVRGRGIFPLDMLRYDMAWPMRGDDVEAIHKSVENFGKRDAWIIQVSTCHPSGLTVGRWESFGCAVKEIT